MTIAKIAKKAKQTIFFQAKMSEQIKMLKVKKSSIKLVLLLRFCYSDTEAPLSNQILISL